MTRTMLIVVAIDAACLTLASLPAAAEQSPTAQQVSAARSRRKTETGVCIPLPSACGVDTAGHATVPPLVPPAGLHPVQPPNSMSPRPAALPESTMSLSQVATQMNPASRGSAIPLPRPSVKLELQARQREREARYRWLQEELRTAIELQRKRREQEAATRKALEERLLDLQKNQRQSSPAPEDKQGQDATGQPESTPSLSGALPTGEQNSFQNMADSDAGNADDVGESDLKKQSLFADSMNATTIVDGPVDRVGLADNLYALGEFTIALEMYEQVVTSKLPPAEVYWVMFQKACCHRRLGHADEAQTLYRRLAGQQPAGWLAKMSRWWLDQMDTRAAIQATLDSQTAMVDSLKSAMAKGNEGVQLK